jgi:hypothetical protein
LYAFLITVCLTCPMCLIFHYVIGVKKLVDVTDHEASHYVIAGITLNLHLSEMKNTEQCILCFFLNFMLLICAYSYSHSINQQIHLIKYNKMQIIQYISWQISVYFTICILSYLSSAFFAGYIKY